MVDTHGKGHQRISTEPIAKWKDISVRKFIHREIDTTDKQIDKLTYDLYNLTEEEVKIIEKT